MIRSAAFERRFKTTGPEKSESQWILRAVVSSVLCCLWLLFTGCAGQKPQVTSPPSEAAAVPSVSQPAPKFPAWPDAVLYFVIVDRFADGDATNNVTVDRNAKGTFHGGDLKGLIQQIDQIADLGVTALWITPVVKNIDGYVTGAGFPDWGYHGYWADDFTKVDPRFGTEEDLKKLREECHKRGIRLLLDVVYNHAGYNSHYLTDSKTKDWFRTEDRGTCGQDDLTSCISGLPDFKTELPAVDEYLWNAQLGLAKRVGLDGFRLDTVKHVDHPFWKEHRSRTRNLVAKDFFLLGEVWGGDAQVLDPWFAGDEIDAGFDFSFQGSALGFVQGRGRGVAFDRYLKMREKIRAGYLVSHFLSSHDVPGALYQLKGETQLFRLAAILEFTSIGIPMIYYGEEVGRMGGDWPDNRSDMPWGEQKILPGTGQPRDETLRADYRRLIAIRKAHPALSRGVHTNLYGEGDTLVFSQQDAESKDLVIVAVNRGSAESTVRVPFPPEWADRQVKDSWNQRKLEKQGDNLELTIPGRGAAIVEADSGASGE